MVLEKTLKSPLDFKAIQPVNPKGNQSWIFIGRTDVEAETPILWPPDVKKRLIGKDPDTGNDWWREVKGTADGWMASPTWWTWVWVGSRSWWWTGRPDVLQPMGSQKVWHDWVTELNWMQSQPQRWQLLPGYEQTQVSADTLLGASLAWSFLRIHDLGPISLGELSPHLRPKQYPNRLLLPQALPSSSQMWLP